LPAQARPLPAQSEADKHKDQLDDSRFRDV
jgi:hypothetical protein